MKDQTPGAIAPSGESRGHNNIIMAPSGGSRGHNGYLIYCIPFWLAVIAAFPMSHYLVIGGLTFHQYEVLTALLNDGVLTSLIVFVIYYISTCVFCVFVVAFVAFMALEYTFPRINGYCYTCGFIPGHRMKAAKRHGLNPCWADVVRNPALDRTVKYEISEKQEIFHLKAKANGESVETITLRINNSRVGGVYKLLPCFEFVQYFQQFMRMAMISLIVLNFPDYIGAIIITITIGFYVMSVDIFVYASVITIIVFNWQPQYGLIAGIMAYLGNEFTKTLLLVPDHDHWKEDIAEPPADDIYIEPNTPSGKSYKYKFHNKNSVYESKSFQHIDMPKEAKDTFIDQTGATITDMGLSGCPHRMVALATKWLVHQLVNYHKPDELKLWINVAGTFRSFPDHVSGVAIQPKLSDADGANAERYCDNEGLGRMVINDVLSTAVDPVGKVTSMYDPGLKLEDAEGAHVVMIHCYEIPVKSLLGFSYANNSKFVDVIMHSDPNMFVETEGELHWSGQTWCRDIKTNSVFYKWDATNGRTYKHNYRVIYEHMNTDYVQVASNTWYVGTVHRNVFDVYHIRWTRQNTKPERSPTRTICMKLRRDHAVIPAIQDNGLFSYKIHWYTTSIQKSEYVSTSKTSQDMAVSLRALTDNYYRNQGESDAHINMNLINDFDLGKRVTQRLRYVIEQGRSFNNSFMSLVGLAPDYRISMDIANCMYRYLMKQPKTKVECVTLYQDEPYMTEIKTPMKTAVRTMSMPTVNKNGSIVGQLDMDQIKPDRVVVLDGLGEDMCEQLCHVLYGRTSGIGAVLPIGEPESGGSMLTKDSPYLLDVELEYLITTFDIQLIVRREDEETVVFGNMTSDRVPIILIDFEKKKVSRIHYPTTLSSMHIRRKFHAIQSDLLKDRTWVTDMHQENPARAYEPHSDHRAEYNGRVASEYESVLEKDGKLRKENAVKDKTVADEGRGENYCLNVEFNKFRTLVVNKSNDNWRVPVISQSLYCMQYDRYHTLTEYNLLPAHHYAGDGIVGLRRAGKVENHKSDED